MLPERPLKLFMGGESLSWGRDDVFDFFLTHGFSVREEGIYEGSPPEFLLAEKGSIRIEAKEDPYLHGWWNFLVTDGQFRQWGVHLLDPLRAVLHARGDS